MRVSHDQTGIVSCGSRGWTVTRYVIGRLRALIFVLVGVSVAVFLMLALVPGDPARAIVGADASEEVVEATRIKLGLDQPQLVQYGNFVANVFRGDLGVSTRTNRPVAQEIRTRLPASIHLAVAAMVVAIGLGLPLGIFAAARKDSLTDRTSMLVAIAGVSVPTYWLGLILILIFSVQLGWLPSSGRGTWQHVVLPALALGLHSMAIIARMVRSSMLEVLNQDYVRTARSKGLSARGVFFKHALKNAMIPTVTILGLQFGYLLAGAIIVETVFAYPGVGWLLIEAIRNRDFPIIRGTILVIAVLFALVNLATDLLYVRLDPRIRYS